MDVTVAYWGGRASGEVEAGGGGPLAWECGDDGGRARGVGWRRSEGLGRVYGTRCVNVVGRVVALGPERPRCGLATPADPRHLLAGCAGRSCAVLSRPLPMAFCFSCFP